MVLPLLGSLPQPVALLEVGASAGLCLLPDRYSYRYRRDGEVVAEVDPPDGASPVVLDCEVRGPGPKPRMPTIAWRAGLDVAPVDIRDDDALAWLETLVWPGQEERRARLRVAAGLARPDPPRVVRGDLRTDLPALAAQAPPRATLVVLHTAVLAYVAADDRRVFAELVTTLPGHWVSNEGRNVADHGPPQPDRPEAPGDFVLALDGRPRAFVGPHGQRLSWLTGPPRSRTVSRG